MDTQTPNWLARKQLPEPTLIERIRQGLKEELMATLERPHGDVFGGGYRIALKVNRILADSARLVGMFDSGAMSGVSRPPALAGQLDLNEDRLPFDIAHRLHHLYRPQGPYGARIVERGHSGGLYLHSIGNVGNGREMVFDSPLELEAFVDGLRPHELCQLSRNLKQVNDRMRQLVPQALSDIVNEELTAHSGPDMKGPGPGAPFVGPSMA